MPTNTTSPVACGAAYAPVLWLGKAGRMTAIKMPERGYSRDFNDNFSVHQLLEGQSADRATYGHHTWNLSYPWLLPDEATVLHEYATRQRGFGPFIFIDPHAKNVLSANQASGTDALLATDGFSVTGTGEALSSSSSWFYQGERSLAWALPASVAVTGGVLSLETPTGYPGWVGPTGEDWSFSGYVRGGGDPTITAHPRITFVTGAGSIHSIVTGTAVNIVTGSDVSFCVTAEIPSGAVYAIPQLAVVQSTVSAVATVYVDALQLELNASCSTWEYGQGQPLVSVTVPSEGVPRIRRSSLSYTLVEVTP